MKTYKWPILLIALGMLGIAYYLYWQFGTNTTLYIDHSQTEFETMLGHKVITKLVFYRDWWAGSIVGFAGLVVFGIGWAKLLLKKRVNNT